MADLHERLFQTSNRQMRNYDFEFDCFVIRETHLFGFDEEPLADGVQWRESHKTYQLILIGCFLASLGVICTLLKKSSV